MKKIIFTHAVTCMCAALIIYKTSCQPLTDIARLNIRTAVIPGYNSALPINTAKEYRNAISIKAAREFIKDFKNAKNVTWSKTDDGGYTAEFTSDSIQTTVGYRCNGSWNYILNRYAESKMPVDVRAIVKSTFFDYAISTVTEIKLPQERENIIYRVLIKNEDNFKILRICNKEMEIAGDFTKP